MSLTAEQIKSYKLWHKDNEFIVALCDMTLKSLTLREEGYRQGLEAAAKIAIKHPSSSGFDIAKDIRGAELEVKK